jgi:uncharacterized membrane protein YfcA
MRAVRDCRIVWRTGEGAQSRPMTEFDALLPIAFGVGVLVGAIGIGGVLLIPALASFAGLGMHQAMATALFTFIFTGIAGTALFQRRGSIDWHLSAPVCAGALFCAFAGAWLNSLTRPGRLALALAALMFFSGIHALASERRPLRSEARSAHGHALLAVIGAAAGFGSGFTGVGGPVLSVPLMVLAGFPAFSAIATSQVIQIIAAASGTLANLRFGTIDFAIALPLTLFEILGVCFGVRIAHALPLHLLRGGVALACIATGLLLAADALLRG